MIHVEFKDQGNGMFSWSITSNKTVTAHGEPVKNVIKSYEPLPKAKALMALASTMLSFSGEYQITFKNGIK